VRASRGHARGTFRGAILVKEDLVRTNANTALLAAGLWLAGGITAALAAAPHPAQTFMAKAAQANMAEVELGKLGANRGQSSDVKQYGQHMVDDHSKANQELQDLAQKEGATLPTYTDQAHQAAKSRLEKLSGDAFDRAFAAQMVKDHQTAVALFRTEARSGRDPEVKAWAAKMLPNLEEHLKQAQALPGHKQASR
jgi:putative membrane protein